MWHTKKIDDVIKELNSNASTGLSTSQASELISKNGKNSLNKTSKKSILKMIFEQLNNILIYILIIAAILSFFLGEPKEALIIFLVIILNASIGIFQESKAEKSLEALKNLSSPKALVKRDNEIIEINSEDLVVGDIVILETGRIIPADLRLIESVNLKIDESTLTGESIPIDKNSNETYEDINLPLGDKKNLAFMSTTVIYGRGTGVVVETGMNTEIGKIASFLDNSQTELTPLQKKLNNLGKQLGILTIAISIIIMVIGLIQGNDLFEIFLTSISLAVAAIPEGLPTIIAMVLAIGVQKMIKKNAIVRKLSAVETLGSVNIICSDKTGTRTVNKMTVVKFFSNYTLLDASKSDINNEANKLLIKNMCLCNDATYSENSKTGDPTEIALLEFSSVHNQKMNYKRLREIPFDSDRKLMTTVNNINDKFYSFTKGAVDNLLSLCTKVLINNEILDLTDSIKNKILENAETMANNALRTLGFAYKEIVHLREEEFENNLVFLGIVGMIDPPREEVKDSIKKAKKSGIKTIMITGDHKNTAFTIAKDLKIADNINQAMLGSEIDNLTDEEFKEKIKNISVFARVSPEHKVKIVRALKSSGNIVSMTGDGVNDAPSLKMADVGIAMGITGTDVSKNASDIILTDDNFKTIITAVEEGRNIFNNIKKSILFLLTCNLGEIITIFLSILFNFPIPLNPTHLLWINLITDSLPALSLGVDTHDKDVMKQKPKKVNERIFSNSSILKLFFGGLLIGIISLISFLIGFRKYGTIYGQTMAFIVLSFSQLFLSLSIRSEDKTILKIGLFSNIKLIYSILIGIIIQTILVTIPFFNNFFNVKNLNPNDWIISIFLSLLPLIINEIFKLFHTKK
ncbi:MAG TPA: cation-translocating P-type ATPase [Candidatus Dwaynia gallinarum]|nr:cation-translocating P-type ATPase [Candidatus Dwaynia gallinarum]